MLKNVKHCQKVLKQRRNVKKGKISENVKKC